MPSLKIPFEARTNRLRIPTPTVRTVFGILIAMAVIVTAIRYFAKAEKPSRLGELTRTAFLRWRPQILALDQGTNIYAAFNYPNPPIMALILKPFASMPPLVGAMTWFLLKVALAALMVRWAVRAVATDRPPPDWAIAVAILLSMHPLLGDLLHGNVNIFVAFLVVSALALFNRRRDFASGIVLALAIACKVTPGLFLPYFVWKRAWTTVAGTLVGLVLWLFVVPSAVLGWQHNTQLLNGWYDGMVKPFVVDGKVTSEHANQSIPGVVFRLLTAEPSFLDYDEDDRPVATDYHNVASLTPARAKLVVNAFMLVFAVGIVLLCRWPTHRADVPRAGPLLAAEYAIILVGMLLFSERTWKHHATTLIVPFAVLAWAATTAGLPERVRAVVRLAMAAIGILMVVPSLLAEESQDLAMVYGAYTAAYVGIGIALAVVIAAGNRNPSAET